MEEGSGVQAFVPGSEPPWTSLAGPPETRTKAESTEIPWPPLPQFEVSGKSQQAEFPPSTSVSAMKTALPDSTRVASPPDPPLQKGNPDPSPPTSVQVATWTSAPFLARRPLPPGELPGPNPPVMEHRTTRACAASTRRPVPPDGASTRRSARVACVPAPRTSIRLDDGEKGTEPKNRIASRWAVEPNGTALTVVRRTPDAGSILETRDWPGPVVPDPRIRSPFPVSVKWE